jgi:hypothetical protein
MTRPDDPRRCLNCGAFDAWTGRQRRADVFDCIVIEHECGVCHQWWAIPIPRNAMPWHYHFHVGDAEA